MSGLVVELSDNKRLRLAQDLNKKTLEIISLRFMKKTEAGIYEMPEVVDVAARLNKLAEQGMVKHYVLQGEFGSVILFDNNEIIKEMELMTQEAITTCKVVKIQCYDKKVVYDDEVPLVLGAIKDLYRLPETLFQSGTCVYFLCHKKEVVYVGQAENVHVRLTEHMKGKVFDSVFYVRVPMNKMNKVEMALIRYLQPKYNESGKSGELTNHKLVIAESILEKVVLQQD